MANAAAVIAGRNYKVFTKNWVAVTDVFPPDTVAWGTPWPGLTP